MVASARATANMANRRRALSTIFDLEAARHANTPATPPAAQPAANLAEATFLASVRTLQREHFDMKVSKSVRQRLVSALQAAFVTEDIGFAPLFLLDDATLPVRVEANGLLFSTLELMVDPMSPAADWMDSSHSSFPSATGQADMLGIRISAGVDPHDAIGDFNAALKAARTRATLLDEDVKALFIKALDTVSYQPVVSRLLLHDQRAGHDLLTIQQWVRECYAAHVKAGTATASAHRYSHGTHFMEESGDSSDGPGELADLRTMVLDLKRQLAALVASERSEPSPRGFTPRADKQDRRMKTRSGVSAYAFAEEAENSVLAAKFQHATTATYCIDHDDAMEFDALCMLAGGKPDIFADLSACSFCEESGEALVSAVTEFSELARTAGASTFNVNTFTASMPVVSGPAARSPPASVGSDGEWTGPPNPFCPPVTCTFGDFIESTGIALGAPDEPPVSMNMLSAIEAPESVMSYEPGACAASDDGDEDASVALPRPRPDCGNFAPPAPFRGVLGDAVGGAVSDAIPPRRQTRYRELRQGFRFYGFLPLPPELVDPDPPIPSSPPYSPPPYSSEDEAPGSGDSAAEIEDSLISWLLPHST
ncbi:hypothetical protein CYMTET_38882 [Cymbomonas tetramitiformis]|uniref:Uncharacterized protein n=1 Tax=Cymbomonas tetramitiformis TaxID=36881 RepID=A0AAE0CCB5_9CHLO|nr:hypothetical protein CYMTET_38882 [Cymbomonas tetramitiformis]